MGHAQWSSILKICNLLSMAEPQHNFYFAQAFSLRQAERLIIPVGKIVKPSLVGCALWISTRVVSFIIPII